MTIKVSLGNADQHLAGPISPTKTSELFTAQGNWKFTVQNVEPGTKWVLQNDTSFNAHLGFSQTQNAKCTFGPTGQNGDLAINPPHSTAVHDQMQVIVYKQPKTGFCDIASAPYLTIQFDGTGPYTFLANVG